MFGTRRSLGPRAEPRIRAEECHPKQKNRTLEDAVCTEGGTRTHTALQPHAPETCVSTNSTTSAFERETRFEPATYSLEGCRSTN